MTDTASIIEEFDAARRERAPARPVELVAADRVMESTGTESDGA